MYTPKPQLLLLLLPLFISACGQSSNNPAPIETPQPTLTTTIDNDEDGFSPEADCDDNNPLIHNVRTFYIDADLDSFGSQEEVQACTLQPALGQSSTNDDPNDSDLKITPLDKDGDGTLAGFDCDDQNSSIAVLINYYADTDADGFGAGEALSLCSNQAPDGFVLSNSDTDDNNPTIVPSDLDGDGVANVDDCAPDDAQKYINQIYYADRDRDNIGSGEPIEVCVALPIPTLNNLSLTTGDSCPIHTNSNKDFDEDGIDDICDLEIRILSDKIISGDEFINFSGLPDGSRNFYIGSENNSVTMEFTEGSTLNVNDDATLYLEGQSRLIIKKTLYDKTPSLLLSTNSLYTGQITGIGNNNRVELHAGKLSLSSGATIDNIDQVYVTTKKLFDPRKAKDITFRSKVFYNLGENGNRFFNGIRYAANANTAPTIKNSSGYWALYVANQMLDVAPIRFLNNNGYPIKCTGDDSYAEEGEPAIFSTCYFATYSRYEGNRFNGPLFGVSYTDPLSNVHFRYDPEMPALNIGTDTIYIENVGLHISNDIARSISFENYIIKANHRLSRDGNGVIFDFGLPTQQNLIPRFRASNTGVTARSLLFFDNSDLREVPLVIEGGHIRATNSQVGTVTFPATTSSTTFTFGSFSASQGSTLDFASSPYVVTDGTNNYGIGLPPRFFGQVVLGSDIGSNPENTEDLIISDASIRYPIIDAGSATLLSTNASDLISATNFTLTKSVGILGSDVDSVFGQDPSITQFYLKLK